MSLRIIVDDLTGAATRALIAAHLAGMHENSPPESVHALDLRALTAPGITVWSAWRDDELVVRGSLDDDHFSAYWLAGDTVTAAMQVNEPRLAGPLRKIVGQAVDRGRLADPGVPLEEHLAG